METALVDIFQVWEWGADNPLSCSYYLLQIFPVCCGSTGVPDCTAVCQDALNCTVVEFYQQFLRESIALQGPQKEEVLLGLF